MGNIINRKACRNKVKLDHVIPNNAIVPLAYKLSEFKSYIHRAFKHCSDQYLEREINYIIENASNHCFQPRTMYVFIEILNKPNLEPDTIIMPTCIKTHNFLRLKQ